MQENEHSIKYFTCYVVCLGSSGWDSGCSEEGGVFRIFEEGVDQSQGNSLCSRERPQIGVLSGKTCHGLEQKWGHLDTHISCC